MVAAGRGWNLPAKPFNGRRGVLAALAFEWSDLLLGYQYEPVDIAVFFTLLLLEGALSFDNAAILAAMVRKLPVEQRRKALLYGLAGAYVFRFTAILFVSFIIANPWLKLVGGAYLVYLMLKHLFDRSPHDLDEVPGVAKKNFLGLSPFWSVVVAVELADIAFALDQVLAAVGLFAERSSQGSKVLLIILASFVAILMLRVSAYYVGRIIDWFPKLELLAYLAVGWVGIKLIAVEAAHMLAGPLGRPEWEHFEISKLISVAITMLLIVIPTAVKAFFEFGLKRKAPF